ncbi:MAG: hypothetical protein RL226_1678 [Bacteroidota bacterium]
MKLAVAIVACIIAFQATILAQERAEVEILNADNILTDPDITDADRLIGNVMLQYRNTLMRCDSAYSYPNGDYEAFGNIAITQGDSIKVFGNNLYLEKNAKECRLRENIRLMDKEMVLTTENLDFNFETSVGSYFNGGKIVSKVNRNVLTSQEGYYDSKSEFFHFRKKVRLDNPEYKVKSDTLKYSGTGETAYFFGPTEIEARNSTIYCVNGWYNTVSEICQFRQGATIVSGSQTLSGDSIYYAGKSGIGEVFGHVVIADSTSSYSIDGDYGWHNELTEHSLVTGRARMMQFFDTDTLYMHADTLQATPDSLGSNRIRAFHHVKLYKKDLQGKADSLTYSEADSLLRMFGSPILWSDENQISGKQIDLFVFGGKIHRMHVNEQAFIISQVVDSAFNQIKGRNLTGFFDNNELRTIVIVGNGQTIYHLTEEKDDVKKVTGFNRADCTDVSIHVKDNSIRSVKLLQKPKGTLSPLQLIKTNDRYLPEFFWDARHRPQEPDDIFLWDSDPIVD